jgi:hypothetical protein
LFPVKLLTKVPITRALIDGANTNIPNRVITVRKDNPPWLTSSIKRVIRRKNRLHKRAKRSNLPGHWERFRIARNKCNNLVSNAKIAHYSKDSENIRLEKAGSENWWTPNPQETTVVYNTQSHPCRT